MCAARSDAFGPWISSSDPYNKFFTEQNVAVAPIRGRFTYGMQNDFGRVIGRMLFCTPKKDFSEHAFANMIAIGVREGFTVGKSRQVYPVRDAKLVDIARRVLECSCSSSLKKACNRTCQRNAALRSHVCFLTKHRSFHHGISGSVAEHRMHVYAVDGIREPKMSHILCKSSDGKLVPMPSVRNEPWGKVKDSRLYYEGGNTFCLTNAKGVPVYLFGRDLLTITHQTLRMDGFFKKKGEGNWMTSSINESLMMSKWGGTIYQLFAAEEIPAEVMKIYQRIVPSIEVSQVEQTLQEMLAMGNLTEADFNKEKGTERGQQLAAYFLAQIEFVAQRIFTEELGVSAEQIHFIPQCAYHLDYLMTPGPEGAMFLQDYALSVALLKHVQEQASDLELTEKDLERLDCFIQEMNQLAEDLKGIMEETVASLQKADLTVIPTPGAFFSHKKGDMTQSEDVNFLNAISGFSKKNQRFFYIASGTHVGDRLGKCLMDAYTSFLQRQCPNITVYFVGRNPADPNDYTEAMHVLNRKESRLGPHCLSFELDIEPYTTLEAS